MHRLFSIMLLLIKTILIQVYSEGYEALKSCQGNDPAKGYAESPDDAFIAIL
jgi:hypothetical protein